MSAKPGPASRFDAGREATHRDATLEGCLDSERDWFVTCQVAD